MDDFHYAAAAAALDDDCHYGQAAQQELFGGIT
jgi:hypothetical protein